MKAKASTLLGASLLFLGPLPNAHAAGPDPATLELYKTKCQICHMADGNSPIKETNFANGTWIHGDKLADQIKVIEEGVPGKAMRSFKDELTKDQIVALAKYVRTFDKKLAGQGAAPKASK